MQLRSKCLPGSQCVGSIAWAGADLNYPCRARARVVRCARKKQWQTLQWTSCREDIATIFLEGDSLRWRGVPPSSAPRITVATDAPELAVVLLTDEGCTTRTGAFSWRRRGRTEKRGLTEAQRSSGRHETLLKVSESTLKSHYPELHSDFFADLRYKLRLQLILK